MKRQLLLLLIVVFLYNTHLWATQTTLYDIGMSDTIVLNKTDDVNTLETNQVSETYNGSVSASGAPCSPTKFSNRIVTSDTIISACGIHLENVTIESGKRLMISETDEITINGTIDVKQGGILSAFNNSCGIEFTPITVVCRGEKLQAYVYGATNYSFKVCNGYGGLIRRETGVVDGNTLTLWDVPDTTPVQYYTVYITLSTEDCSLPEIAYLVLVFSCQPKG